MDDLLDDAEREPRRAQPDLDGLDLDGVTTTAEDVASAGRSCLVILAMVAVIVILLLVWVVVTTVGR